MSLSSSFLTWLRCFEAAARLRSFTRAAAELHLTQSAVSQQIRLLEQRLGSKLFHRLPGHLEVTARGNRLFLEVSPALKRIANAVLAMRTAEGPLHISCSPSFAHRWLVPRLGAFIQEHPEIDIHLRAEFHALERWRFLQDGLHVALRYDRCQYADLRSEDLMDEYLLPVVGTDRPGAQIDRLDPAAVTLLHDSEPWDGAPAHVEWETLLEPLNLHTEDFRSRLFNLADLALASARAGEGAAAARTALVMEDLENGRLRAIPQIIVPARCRYVMLSLDDEDWRVAAFANWIKQQCREFVERRDAFVESLTDATMA